MRALQITLDCSELTGTEQDHIVHLVPAVAGGGWGNRKQGQTQGCTALQPDRVLGLTDPLLALKLLPQS